MKQRKIDDLILEETVEEIKTTQYRWTCPKCALKQHKDHARPTKDELVCHRCIEKEETTKNQKRLEDLLLCAKVVKVESEEISHKIIEEYDERLHKVKRITLLCSDDKTMVELYGPENPLVQHSDYTERLPIDFSCGVVK